MQSQQIEMRKILINVRCESCCGQDVEGVILVPKTATNDEIEELVKEGGRVLVDTCAG
jgi:hypothetical protein